MPRISHQNLPTGTTFVSAGSTAGWTETAPGSGIFHLTIGALTAGASASTATFVVTVTSPAAAGLSNIVNAASIADDGANGTDPTPANNSSTDTTPSTRRPT